ncbi:MAG: hypothetical protein KGZ96_14345 [Clostridia bacterium]|jgi:hypothetical protein|nr:hypothetical protein [Clostridia bacterium]
MKKNWIGYLLWGLVVISILVSLGQAAGRHKLEESIQRVELMVEFNELLQAVERLGQGELAFNWVLMRLKDAGVSSILYKEETLEDLWAVGELKSFLGVDLLTDYRGGRSTGWVTELGFQGKLNPYHVYLEIYDLTLWERVTTHLQAKTKGLQIYQEPEAGQAGILSSPVAATDIFVVGIGYPRETIALLDQQGFHIWLQLRDWQGPKEEGLRLVIAEIKSLPRVDGIMFNDATIPGIPNQAGLIAGMIDDLGAPVAVIEFYEKQQGHLSSLIRSLKDKNVVRLHTISQRELNGLTETGALDRYELAVNERNIRVILLRYIDKQEWGRAWLDRNVTFVEKLVERLELAGYQVGQAESFTSLPFAKMNILLISMGALAGGALLVGWFGFPKLGAAAALAGMILTALLLAREGKVAGFESIDLVRKAMSLGAVTVFPTLAVIMFLDQFGSKSVRKSVITILKITMVSLIGAVMMIGLLADLTYMVKVNQFVGVKLAHTLPVTLVIGYLAIIKAREEEWLKAGWSRLGEFFHQPLLLGPTLAVIILAVIYYIYVDRTGNQSTFVTGTELQVRSLLDQVLGVRPRTKEFLIGHPVMLLVLYFGYKFRYGFGLLLIGIIGQVSLINTFAHIHTPIVISLIRTGYGLAIGVAIGLVLLAAYRMNHR